MSREAKLARRFIAAWNASDDLERIELLRQSCDEGALFVSPQGIVTGCIDMSESIGAFLRAFPGSRVSIGHIDVEHGFIRFPWTTSFGDGRPDLGGDDYAEVGESGLISKVVSFDGRTTFPAG